MEVIKVGKQVRRELLECANGLLRLSLASSLDEIQSLIDDGYYHLREMQGECNPVQKSALLQRLDKAEYLLIQKRKQLSSVR